MRKSKKSSPWIDVEKVCRGKKKDGPEVLTEWKADTTFYITSPQDFYLVKEVVANGGQYISHGNFPEDEDWNSLSSLLGMLQARGSNESPRKAIKKGAGSSKAAAA